MPMITARFCPRDDAGSILRDDEIYDRISDDECPPKEQLRMPFDAKRFIGGYVDEKIASLFIVHDQKMHFMVLKKYRLQARELLAASFKLWPHPVYVEIPMLYRSVINFAKKAGFCDAGVSKQKYKKNGQIYDKQTLIYEG